MEKNRKKNNSTADKEKDKVPFGNFNSVSEYTENGLRQIIEATRSANALPQGTSRDLYCSYPTFGVVVDNLSDRILSIISKVLKWQNIKGNIERRHEDERFEMLMEFNDSILERINTNLDEIAGVKNILTPAIIEKRTESNNKVGKGAGSWNLKDCKLARTSAVYLPISKNVLRPQLKFRNVVDNSIDNPFIPRLKEKPNSLKPLAILPEYDESGCIASYLHPYEFELMKFEVKAEQLKRKQPQNAKDIKITDVIIVDNIAKLKVAVEELSQCNEVAIDVEHHSYRSFLGLTCIVQVSTRSKDYIFDALELREDMHILNTVFTNPKVVKIFHGADLDVQWLQRDLSLYIVNMFDTHQAAKILNFARLSLSFLLKHYCDVETDKRYQLADWRIRPLPNEFILYARQDTHYLIYIYECMSNEVLDISNENLNLLRLVYERSTEICKKKYMKPQMVSEAHMELFRKSKRNFDNRQLYALREIFQWRDNIARQEDESYGYVLPNHMMLHIAETLPREMQGILACCNPIPILVRQHLHTLHQIVLRAREQTLITPIQEEVSHRIIPLIKDYNSKLHCAHDLSHNEEFRDDLITLITHCNTDENSDDGENLVHLNRPVLNIFESNSQQLQAEQINKSLIESKLIVRDKMQSISPYRRYLAILPVLEKEKHEEELRIQKEQQTRILCPSKPVVVNLEEAGKTHSIKEEHQDNEYGLPVRQMLKRKSKETRTGDNHLPQAKRGKIETYAPSSENLKPKNPESGKVQDCISEKATTSKGNYTKPQNRNKKLKMLSSKQSYQSSDQPITNNFNYSKVDYKKFSGGAQHANTFEVKSHFHGKGKGGKIKNKAFNKLMSFSNVKNNKK